MKKLLRSLILFIVFGAIYYGFQCAWKQGPAHWTMFALGGIIGVLISDINDKIEWNMPIFQQCTIALGVAIFSDAVAGIILNIILQLNVWHYTRMEFFWNQCSLPYCIIWFILGTICIFLDDWLQWKLFGGEKPHYKLR